FCPATDAQGAKELIRRIWSVAAPRPVRGGAATFPLDGLVLDDLIDQALVEARGAQEAAPATPAVEPTEQEWIRASRTSCSELDPRHRTAARVKRAFDLAFSVLTAPVWVP